MTLEEKLKRIKAKITLGLPLSQYEHALWASEIEPFPITVTKARLPKMKHLGDVTKIDGSKIPPVDVLTFGSPCQDLSVAGRRAGLDGERSGLFLEAIRIIKEMRGATNGRYPSIAVWENVPGAFSSNNGEDFRTVLEELCKIKNPATVIPRPTTRGGSDGKWLVAGSIVADGFSLAWRVLDAQYWGVPQRRRRIFLVADFRDECATEILFEREGLQRRFAESRETWHGITPGTTYGSYAAGKCFDARGKGNGNIAPTITGDHNDRVSDYSAIVVVGVDTYNQSLTGSKSKILLARHQDADGVPCVAINQAQNIGIAYRKLGLPDKVGALCASDLKYVQNQSLVQQKLILVPKPVPLNGNTAGTLDANYDKGCGTRGNKERELIAQQQDQTWVVRRLMPIECARLQGMPDWWCKDVPHADAPEYKMWGNGMALPCVMYVMQGISAWWRKRLLEVCA